MDTVIRIGNRVLARLRGELASALLRTFIARGVAAVGSFVFVLVLGQLYGAVGVGVFAIAQSIIIGAAIIARYGMDNTLMRFVGRDQRSSEIMLYLYWAFSKAVPLSIIGAFAIFLGRGLFEQLFDAEDLSLALIGIAIATPAFTLSYLLAGFMKGVRKPAIACLLENGSISLVASFLLLGLNWLRPAGGLESAGFALALAAWLVFAQGAWHCRCWSKKVTHVQSFRDGSNLKSDFVYSSRAFFVTSLAQFMQLVLAMLIAGYFLDSSELGLFRTAQQVTLLVGFVLIVINAVFPPRFASSYYEGDIGALQKMARQGSIVGIVLASPVLGLCLLAPKLVLGLFGSEFTSAVNLLWIMAIAQFVQVSSGSVGYLLNMTGYEQLMSNIALLCGVWSLALFFLLVPALGSVGAALAFALTIVTRNFICIFFVWTRLEIWVLPIPNFLRLAGIRASV